MIPALFIAHGSPLLAVEEDEYTAFLRQLGQDLTRPQAIVLFSAHWEASVQKVSRVKDYYSTIHDFEGFPHALYQIKYPVQGDDKIAEQVESLLTAEAIPFEMEKSRGLDHGAWVVLARLYPHADVFVTAMSVNPHQTVEQLYRIGKALKALRENDVLIIASGGTVHNLQTLAWQTNETDDWALEFDRWLEERIMAWDLDSLYQYRTLAPNASLAVPLNGTEHFVPLFYAMGAADNVRKATLLYRSYRYGNLSHSVWRFG